MAYGSMKMGNPAYDKRHKARIRRYGNPGPKPAIPLPIWERLTFVKTK